MAFGAVFAFEIDDQLVVFFGVFPRQEDEHASSVGEAVAQVILRGCGFALYPSSDRRRVVHSPGSLRFALRWTF